MDKLVSTFDRVKAKLAASKDKKRKEKSKIASKASSEVEYSVSVDGITVTFYNNSVVGTGSFGVVFEGCIAETGEVIAIKKVLQDQRYKNRELAIIKTLNHPNVVKMLHYFHTKGDTPDQVYLNLVLEFVPQTIYQLTKSYTRSKKQIPDICVKLYVYQLCRSLIYIHSMGICHRDIKPQNILVDPTKHILKLCDFGSAKKLSREEPNISYICSRYYRAPELIFGSTHYTTAVDVWSVGCVFAELLLGQPIFPGATGVDQLVEIIKVLGTPTDAQIKAMNQNYTEFKFPEIQRHPWEDIFPKLDDNLLDILSKMLEYVPTKRIDPLTALSHPYFDELREPDTTLPNGEPLPPLFNFTPQEYALDQKYVESLIPDHAKESNLPVDLKGVRVYQLHHPKAKQTVLESV